MNPEIEAYFEQCDLPSYNEEIHRWYLHRRGVAIHPTRPGWILLENYSIFGYHEKWIYDDRAPGPGYECETGFIYDPKIYPIWIRLGDSQLHRMVDYGAPLKNKWKPKPLPDQRTCLDDIGRDVRNIIFRYLILPETHPDVVAAKEARKHPTKIMKKYGGRCQKTGKKLINRYKGEHPTTIQHKWLRVMAQVCRSWHKHIKAYRSMILEELLKKAWWSNRNDYNINFLLVEQNMTEQQTKHRKAVKKTKSRKAKTVQSTSQQTLSECTTEQLSVQRMPWHLATLSGYTEKTQRNNQIVKWHRRIAWYEKQLADPQIPAKTARTFQVTLDYLKQCDPPVTYSRYHWLSEIKRNHLEHCQKEQERKRKLGFVMPSISYAAIVSKSIQQKSSK